MTSGDMTPGGQFLIHTPADGQTRVRCLSRDETLWLTQAQMAELFQVSAPTINEHLGNLFDEGECEPERTVRKFRIVRTEGGREVRRMLEHYRLEAAQRLPPRPKKSRPQ